MDTEISICSSCKQPMFDHKMNSEGTGLACPPPFDFQGFLKAMGKQAREQGFSAFADMVEKDAEKQNPFSVGEKK